MTNQIINLLKEEPKEVQEAVLELLMALKEAKGKETILDPVEVLKTDAELILNLIAFKNEIDDLSFFKEETL